MIADEMDNSYAFRRLEMFESLQQTLASRGEPHAPKDIAALFAKMENSGKISYQKKENAVKGDDSVRKLTYMGRRFREAGVYEVFKELQRIQGARTVWASWTIVCKVPTYIQKNEALRFAGFMIHDAMTEGGTMSRSLLVKMLQDASSRTVPSMCSFLTFKYDFIVGLIMVRWHESKKCLLFSRISASGGKKFSRRTNLGLPSICASVCRTLYL